MSFRKWFDDIVLPARRRKALLTRAAMKMKYRMASAAFDRWMQYHQHAKAVYEQCTHALLRIKNMAVAKAFTGWRKLVDAIHIARRAFGKLANMRLMRAWNTWVGAVEQTRWERTRDGLASLHQQMEDLRAENERLRRDNERFVRMIDSGAWSRARVDELARVRAAQGLLPCASRGSTRELPPSLWARAGGHHAGAGARGADAPHRRPPPGGRPVRGSRPAQAAHQGRQQRQRAQPRDHCRHP